MHYKDRCGGRLLGERKCWADRVAESFHGRGLGQGRLALSFQALGPGNRGHFTGEREDLGMRLPFACVPQTLGQANTQALRVGVRGGGGVRGNPSLPSWPLQVSGDKPGRLPALPQVRTTVPSQGSWAQPGPLPEGVLHSCYCLGRTGLRPAPLVPLAGKGTAPKSVYEKNWYSRDSAERGLEGVTAEGRPSEASICRSSRMSL